MHDDHLYLDLAERQYGLVLYRQLLGLGFSGSAILRRRRAGLLRDVARGLYAVAGAPIDAYECQVAVPLLLSGALCSASHLTAARLAGMRGWAGVRARHVTVARPADLSVRGVEVHRSEIFSSVDLVQRSAVIPLTRPERTVIGIAEVQPGRAAAAVDEAILGGFTTIERLWKYLTRYGGPGCPGSAAVKEVLARRNPCERPSESDLERAWIAALAAHGVAGWIPQYEVMTEDGRRRIDLAHSVAPIGLEFDSRLWHSSEEDYRRERRKRYLLAKAGYRIFPVTEFDLEERVPEVATDVLAATDEWLRAADGAPRPST